MEWSEQQSIQTANRIMSSNLHCQIQSGVVPSLHTVTYGKVEVKRGQCFQGSEVETPPDWEIQAVTAPSCRKSETRRMRHARRPGKCTVRARFSVFGAIFGQKCAFLAISGNSPSPEN